MKRYLLALFILFPVAAWSGAYKCTNPDGTVSYQQIPCAEEKNQADISTYAKPPSSSAGSPEENPYSIQNQIRQIEERDARQRAERRERRSAAALEEIRKHQQRRDSELKAKLSAPKCEYYKAQVNERKHKLRQAYQNKGDKLHDESHLRFLEMRAAEYCN